MTLPLQGVREAALPATGATLPASDAIAGAAARSRIDSIDLLRGAVMLLMALDHTRDFLAAGGFNARDVTDPALFMTRWVTHFCAPVFIMLAGISAFLYGAKRRSLSDLSYYLATRGFWLVVMEFTIVRLGWTFDLRFDSFVTQVIFAIGASMLAMAVLVHLPRWAIATVSVVMIAGHNLLDGINASSFGAAAPVWILLHERGVVDFGGLQVYALYPLIPWIGVMAAGYALGPVFQQERAVRVRRLLALGAAITGGFMLLRASNLYGDPAPWTAHDSLVATVLSFINCEKYPPSLLFLAMTLGPGLMLLAAFESARGRVAQWIMTYGRVPFFYYVAHIFLIHALALAYAWTAGFDTAWLLGAFPPNKPAGYGLGLPGVYAVTLIVIVVLYPLCRYFAAIKRRRHEWWLSYL